MLVKNDYYQDLYNVYCVVLQFFLQILGSYYILIFVTKNIWNIIYILM